MFRMLFFIFCKDALPIRLYSCAIRQVWAYPLKLKKPFPFLENVKYVKGEVYNYHKLKLHREISNVSEIFSYSSHVHIENVIQFYKGYTL